MISYLSIIFILVILTGGITSALLTSSLSDTSKVIVLTIYITLLFIVIIGFIVSKVEELVNKSRKEILETLQQSLDYTKDNAKVLKELNDIILLTHDATEDVKELMVRNHVILGNVNKRTVKILDEIRDV
jgi:ABC-type transport system involved in multi-copper enzyme maturation permease subunit|uniref:Uncharacterized protein n=1 Tax=CrAss-like virus sp. ctt4r3 TaxID=2823619 RepID=A0A8S5L7D7_9CAUD|nr:MAG TPA: hypothetical protein [CrAss-like virus sp. ctt4r3]